MKEDTNKFLFLFLPRADKGHFKLHLLARSGCWQFISTSHLPYIFHVYRPARRRRKALWEESLLVPLWRCLLRMTTEVWVSHVKQVCLRVVFLSCLNKN